MNIQGISNPRLARAACGIGIAALSLLHGCGGTSTRPELKLNPQTVTAAPGDTVKFTATPSFAPNSTVPKYEVLPQTGVNVGTIDTDGTYHVPLSVPANFVAKIQASILNGSVTTLPSTVSVPLTIAVTPQQAQVSIRRQLQFYAKVTGDPANQVTWTVQTADGSVRNDAIDANGLYTAPNTITKDGIKETITAQSKVPNGPKASVVVTIVVADPVTISVQ